jgi:hypothetical protein
MKTKPFLAAGTGVLFLIATVALEFEPKLKLGEPEHTEQSQNQQETMQLEVDALMDAPVLNTHTGTAAALGDWAARYLGPKDFL